MVNFKKSVFSSANPMVQEHLTKAFQIVYVDNCGDPTFSKVAPFELKDMTTSVLNPATIE